MASLGVRSLIGPKVVAAGVKKMRDGVGAVTVPALLGHPSDYCVMLTNTGPSSPWISGDLSAGKDGAWSFEISAGSADAVHYAVIKTG